MSPVPIFSPNFRLVHLIASLTSHIQNQIPKIALHPTGFLCDSMWQFNFSSCKYENPGGQLDTSFYYTLYLTHQQVLSLKFHLSVRPLCPLYVKKQQASTCMHRHTLPIHSTPLYFLTVLIII